MKLFYFRNNKDAGDPYLEALHSAGYKQVMAITPESSAAQSPIVLDLVDFLFMDHDYTYKPNEAWSKHFTDEALREHPMFIYPHTPYSQFLWDGIVEPKLTACNFVVSEGAKTMMELYGYPYPVEVVGFSNCEVKPFKPTSGGHLLFTPAHPVHDGKFPHPDGLDRVRKASAKIIRHLSQFESVTIRWHGRSLASCGLDAFEGKRVIFDHINVYKERDLKQKALAAIEKADIVISESTFGYLAVASGKPTLFYGFDDTKIPHSREGWVKNYHLYKHLFHFPLHFESMSIQDILSIRERPHPDIEVWKKNNIGNNFNPDKMIEVVNKCLS